MEMVSVPIETLLTGLNTSVAIHHLGALASNQQYSLVNMPLTQPATAALEAGLFMKFHCIPTEQSIPTTQNVSTLRTTTSTGSLVQLKPSLPTYLFL
ncbi:hypothetical protein DSO57_1038939 [Entomophthora muscae]|uniref:Uncharacterized protein n=1 Tax=Entomophthora muscae TaxID=34485 RepID=A0ACC2U860_9FUNG|nr:hypothetical protein DSO57_1038939 [Entomophthora muscae]